MKERKIAQKIIKQYKSNYNQANLVADKDDELLQVLDENGNPTGRFEKRGIVHNNKLFHNEVALWIIDKENKKVLLQRRSPNKKQNPNKLAICAGHVVGNETILEALKKETKEELGLDIKDCEVNQLLTIKRVSSQNYCFSHNYYLMKKIPLQDIIIQKEELTEVLYMDYEQLKQLVRKNSDEVALKWEVYEPVFEKLDEVIK